MNIEQTKRYLKKIRYARSIPEDVANMALDSAIVHLSHMERAIVHMKKVDAEHKRYAERQLERDPNPGVDLNRPHFVEDDEDE